jgi:S1-C subfamily serine protease
VKALTAVAVCLLIAGSAAAQAPVAASNWGPPRAQAVPAAQPTIHPAVARIVAPGEGSVSYGSGTLVYSDASVGVVVTNWHVINEATQPISVHFPDGFYSLATVQKVDRDWDLALLAIRKPNVQPVPLASQPPRPGEMLTIAGYGSGTYRAASGPCTQYVAPGKSLPFEMVEVAVSARQGDSGGPILNARGELAGVLFGEGHGRTSGSYCGRVRWFLASVVPNMSTQLASAPTKPVASPQASDATGPLRGWNSPVVQTGAQTSATRAGVAAGGAVVASTRASGAMTPQVQTIGWEDIAGATVGEQVKTILAAIGLLAVLLHALRWMSGEHRPA